MELTSTRRAADATAARSSRGAGVGPASVPFDETLPFPPPLAGSGRVASTERGLSQPTTRGRSLEQFTEASLARVRYQQLDRAAQAPVQAATLVKAAGAEAPLGRLYWRGRELSREFHEYALRVSRGENLAPFRGQLLADECLALPWESVDSRPLRSRAPRVVGLLLAGLALVAALTGILASQEHAPAWSEVAALAPPMAQPEVAPLAAAERAASVQSPSPPAAEISLPVPAAPPVPQQPRKPRVPTPAPAAVAEAASALLVEEPPF